MTTPEQQALQLAAQAWCTPATSGLEMDVNLATAVAEKFAPIIAENAALKAELAAIKGAGEPVAWGVPNFRITEKQPFIQVLLDIGHCQYPELLVPLYTRPCVPLTDERASDLGREMVKGGKSVEWLVREVERAHGIKGAKGC